MLRCAPNERSLARALLSIGFVLCLLSCSGGGGSGGGKGGGPAADNDSDELPPDPATVATTLDTGAVPSFEDAFAFLYDGADPVQLDVAPGTLEPELLSVLRGRVVDEQGAALSGVRVTVLDQPELGRTLTREDGGWDLAVNGGERLTLCFEREGSPPVHRSCVLGWNAFECVPDLVMMAFDEAATDVSAKASAPLQCARGSAVEDERGVRQTTVVFPAGTTAEAVLPDGSRQALESMTVRATEYTVGEAGPGAMPATLPPTSAYTWCSELSVDEAVELGADTVVFSQPVLVYLENFLDFPVGTVVPAGTYDRGKACWVPDPDGRVVALLAEDAGLAVLDVDGSDAAATPEQLAALGIDDDELTELARLYDPGATLWRVPRSHFSPCDLNWPAKPPPGALAPAMPEARPAETPDPCECDGSILEVQNQTLGETIPVPGTPFSLNYRSDRLPGNHGLRHLRIPLTAEVLPPGLTRVDVQVTVLGVVSEASFAPAPDLVHEFVWDGRDAYGREFPGAALADVRIGYAYEAVYGDPFDSDGEGFAGYAGAPLESSAGVVVIFQDYTTAVGGLDGQHVYDPVRRRFYDGDGTVRDVEGLDLVSRTIEPALPFGSPFAKLVHVVAAPDGGLH
jgi:hypothetical protein